MTQKKGRRRIWNSDSYPTHRKEMASSCPLAPSPDASERVDLSRSEVPLARGNPGSFDSADSGRDDTNKETVNLEFRAFASCVLSAAKDLDGRSDGRRQLR